MTSYLNSLKQKLKDKRYWKKDPNSTDFLLTEEGQEISFKIEKEKLRLKELKENDPVYLAKKIDKHCKDLFKGITQKDMPASGTPRTEVIDDYIRPSRERNKGFLYEIDEDMRISLYNGICYTLAILDDALEQIEEIEESKK
jgi:hypothetical protein